MIALSGDEVAGRTSDIVTFVRTFLPPEWPASIADYLVGPPVRLQQCCAAQDDEGQLVMFMTWAFLSPERASDIEVNGNGLLHPSEWNEDVVPWVIDLYSLAGMPLIARRALRTIAAEFGSVRSVAIDGQGREWRVSLDRRGGRRTVSREPLDVE